MKKLLISLGILVALVVLAGVAIHFLVDVNAYKPRIVSAVSDALGMEIDEILSKAEEEDVADPDPPGRPAG